MPVLISRSPPSVESPPRKKFKFSLKLKPKKKKEQCRNPTDSDSETESSKESKNTTMNVEKKSPLESTTPSRNQTHLTQAFHNSSPPLPYTGLANLGNTCYMNAVLQVLRYCPQFLKFLRSLDEVRSPNSSFGLLNEGSLCCEMPSSTMDRSQIIATLKKLTSKMDEIEENYKRLGMDASDLKTYSGCTTLAMRPSEFLRDFSRRCPMFDGYQQHDAQEFLRSFLAILEEECCGLEGGRHEDNIAVNLSTATLSSTSKVKGGCKYPASASSGNIAVTTEVVQTQPLVAEKSKRAQDNANYGTGPSVGPTSTGVKCELKGGKTATEDSNIVKRLFEGTLLLQTCCLNCEGLSERYETFQDISVPVQDIRSSLQEDRVTHFSDSEDESEQDFSLSCAISKFASIERLNGENKYFCENCSRLTEADISTYFEKLPQVFTIHLKRFQTSYGNQGVLLSNLVTKVTKSLHTPQKLSFEKWCSKTCAKKDETYYLFGVVMHSGMSSCSGHYLSYINVDMFKKCDNIFTHSDLSTSNEEEMMVDSTPVTLMAQDFKQDRQRKAVDTNEQLQSDDYETNQGVDNGVADDGNDSQHDLPRICDSMEEKQKHDTNEQSLLCEESLSIPEKWTQISSDCVKNSAKQHERDNDVRRVRRTRGKMSHRYLSFSDDSSSDEDDHFLDVPISMDITKFFKPIPKPHNSVRVSQQDSKTDILHETNKGNMDVTSSDVSGLTTVNKNVGLTSGQSSAFTVPRKNLSSTTKLNGVSSISAKECYSDKCSFPRQNTSGATKRDSPRLGPYCCSENSAECNPTWLKFDDAEVTRISHQEMNEILSPSTSCYSTPYLLFYCRS